MPDLQADGVVQPEECLRQYLDLAKLAIAERDERVAEGDQRLPALAGSRYNL